MGTPLKIVQRVRVSPFAFPMAALAALAVFFVSETSYERASGSLSTLGAMSGARGSTYTLWRTLVDAETGQRGYLLTGRKEYLDPYTSGVGQVPDVLSALNRYYAEDPRGAPLMRELTRLANEKLSELRTTIDLHDAGRDGAWRDLLLSNIGQEKMTGIRRVAEELLEVETTRVRDERQRVSKTILINRIGVSAMTALSLLALFLYLRETSALDRQRTEQQRQIKAERDRLEAEVRLRTEQLTELARHLQTAREDERSRLARDLHDELGALLTAAKLDAARLKSRLGTQLSPEAADRLTHLNESLNRGIALKRRIIEDLRPSSLSNLGLVAALEILTREFSERSSIEVRCTLQPVRLTATGELMVYRLVQEALTNIAKYARATLVQVVLGSIDGKVTVEVKDNGVGFDTDQPRASAHGLLGMRYRVEAEGGVMSLDSRPGLGTRICAVLPEHAPDTTMAAAHAA